MKRQKKHKIYETPVNFHKMQHNLTVVCQEKSDAQISSRKNLCNFVNHNRRAVT